MTQGMTEILALKVEKMSQEYAGEYAQMYRKVAGIAYKDGILAGMHLTEITITPKDITPKEDRL
jgi:hypothetical protein